MLSWHAQRMIRKVRRVTTAQVLVVALPVALGCLLAVVITRGDWHIALALAAVAPLAVMFSARPVIGVFLWLLLMPFFSALPNPDLMYWGIHRLLIPFTLIIAYLPHLINPGSMKPLKLGLPEACIFLLALWIPVSVLMGPMDTRVSLIKYADRFLIPFCMYMIVRIIVLKERDINLLQWLALLIVGMQSLIGILSWVMPQVLPRAWQHLVGARTAGSLLDPAVFTSMLMFCGMLLLYAAIQRGGGWQRFLFLAACGASFLSVFISLERGSWLAGGMVMLGMLVLQPKLTARLLLIAAVAAVVFGGSFFLQHINLATQRITSQQPIDDRIVVTDAMLHMIEKKPIFGWGYDTLNNYIRQFYRQVGSASIKIGLTTSHNTYLTIFTELGLLGFLLYLLPTAWLLADSVRLWRKMRPRLDDRLLLIAVLWLGALQNFLVSNFMDMRFYPIGLTLWWLSLGLIANQLYAAPDPIRRIRAVAQ